MSRFEENTGDDEPKTPAWIVSYSDMVTLLLAFFVLLQAFAEEQDPELFRVGQGAFQRAIAGFGIPNWLFGREQSLGVDRKPKFSTEESEKPQKKRVMDARDEKIRQIFDDLKRMADTHADNDRGNPATVIKTPIRFGRSQTALDDHAMQYLDGVCQNIRYGVREGDVTVYVVASAPDVRPGRKQWFTAARRAWEVRRYVSSRLNEQLGAKSMEIISWAEPADPTGAGAGDAQFVRIAIKTEK